MYFSLSLGLPTGPASVFLLKTIKKLKQRESFSSLLRTNRRFRKHCETLVFVSLKAVIVFLPEIESEPLS